MVFVIYQVGVIDEGGLPVITRIYHKKMGDNSQIQLGLLNAILDFSEAALADISEVIKLKNNVIILKKFKWGEEDSLLYALCSRETPESLIMKCLARLEEEVVKYDHTAGLVTSKKFDKLFLTIDEITGDLKYRPEDRAEDLFGGSF
ncbi:MAG: hypothetical protein ACFFBD_02730 [Candidatus Hodarchaeota archaeon]